MLVWDGCNNIENAKWNKWMWATTNKTKHMQGRVAHNFEDKNITHIPYLTSFDLVKN
jgi:hypothetical protein